MGIFTFFVLSVLVNGQTFPDERAIDSLYMLLPGKTGTGKVDLLIELSRAKWNISLEESLEYATNAYQLAEHLDYTEGKADALNRMGNVHYLLRNHSNAIENYMKAVRLAGSLQDHKRLGMYLNNVGLYYREINLYDSSEIYLIKSLKSKELHGDIDLIASTLNNLGVLYRDKQRYNLSLEYFLRQLDIREPSRDYRSLANINNHIGEVFYLKERFDESIRHFQNSLNQGNQLKDSLIIATASSNLGKSYFAFGDAETAIEYINKSIDLAKTINSQPVLRDNYRLLHHLHKESGNIKNAFDYMILYSNLKDSIRTRNADRRFVQLERIFETEKQNTKIDLLQKENQIQELQLNRHENIKYFMMMLILMLIIFKLTIGYRFLSIQKTNKTINNKINELEETNNKLEVSAAALEQLNATKNRFFSIIAHDLKNPFNALLGFSEMITNNFSELTEKEIREYISIVHQSSQNLYKLLENLLKWSAAQTGTMHYLPESFDLVNLIRSEINLIRIRAAKKGIDISVDLPDELGISSDKLLLSSVIRNLLDNALKFTHKGGEVHLTAREDGNGIYFDIRDSGIGIPPGMKEKLFSIDGNICRKGTSYEEGGGLGLILCKELIEKAGGTIGVESETNQGSRFWFKLPSKSTKPSADKVT